MTNWILPPDLQKRYQQIAEETKRLQTEFGIVDDNKSQKHSSIGLPAIAKSKRPPPKWKV